MRRAAAVALAGAALLLAAFMFDSSTLFVPAVALLVLPALVKVWIWLTWRVASVERDLEAERVIEDEPVEARIELRGPLGLPGAELRDPLASGSIGISAAPWTRQVELRVLARFPIGAVCLCRRRSSGWVTRWGSFRRAGSDQIAARSCSCSRARRGSRGAGVERGLDFGIPARPTPPSRPARPSPMACGSTSLVLRPLGFTGRPSRVAPGSWSGACWPMARAAPWCVLDGRCVATGALLDAAVRAAASLTLELARREGCDLLLPGHRRPMHIGRDLGAWPVAHAQLALVEGGPEAPPPALGGRTRADRIFYVAAHPLDTTADEHQSRRSDPRSPLGAHSVRRTRAGLRRVGLHRLPP